MDSNTQELINELNNRVDELEQENEDLKQKLGDFSSRLDKLSSVFDKHTHNNLDGSLFIKNYIPRIGGVGDIIQFGEGAIISQEESSGNNVYQVTVLSTGIPDKITQQPQAEYVASTLQLSQIKGLDGEQSIIFAGIGRSQLVNTEDNFSISSAASTIPSGKFSLITNAFAGCIINIIENGSVILQREVASNTQSGITIKGTWGVTKSNIQYIIYRPIMLGESSYRYRSLSLFGIDATGDRSQVIGMTIGESGSSHAIVVGTGVPTYAAPNGSLYLRKDGTSTTTLYIRAAGAWVAK